MPPEGQEYRLEVRLKALEKEAKDLEEYEQTVVTEKEQ